MTPEFSAVTTDQRETFVQSGRNVLHTIVMNHFQEFSACYDDRYAVKYGRFRLERIAEVGEHFASCGDYSLGFARIHGFAVFPALVRKWQSGLSHFTHSVWESVALLSRIIFPTNWNTPLQRVPEYEHISQN